MKQNNKMENVDFNTEKTRGTVGKVLRLVHHLTPGYLTFLVLIRIMSSAQPFINIFFSRLDICTCVALSCCAVCCCVLC